MVIVLRIFQDQANVMMTVIVMTTTGKMNMIIIFLTKIRRSRKEEANHLVRHIILNMMTIQALVPGLVYIKKLKPKSHFPFMI